MNSVIENANAHGISSAGRLLAIANRITNNGDADNEYGISTTGLSILIANYFGGNKGAGAANNDKSGIFYDTYVFPGSDLSNTYDGTDTDQGYTDSAGGDYNLSASATKRIIAIPLD